MRRRVLVLLLVAAVLGLVLLEFGAVSPWRHQFRSLIEDYRIHRLRAQWRPPCKSDTWAHIQLDAAAVPVPECLDYQIHPPLSEDLGPTVFAFDPRSPGTILLVSVDDVAPDRAGNLRAASQRRSCSVLRNDEVLVWTCLTGVLNALVNDKWLSTALELPKYLEDDVRERESHIMTQVVSEFVRMQHEASAQGAS